MYDKMGMTPLDVVGKLAEMASSVKSDSLVEFTKSTRVEPVTLVDQILVTNPVLTDVLQSLSSIFAAYYLQAIALTNKIGGVEVIRRLDPLNPNRDVLGNTTGFIGSVTTEDFRYTLPVPGESYGLEAYGDLGNSSAQPASKLDSLTQATNLSVGKLLEVEVSNGQNKAKIPVALRLIVSIIATDTLVHTLSLKSKDVSVKERYHAWRAGALSTIKDMILCQDLIDEHRKSLIKDTSGIYRASTTRSNKNVLSALLSGQPSIATASNIVVISDRAAKQLEVAVNGKLKDYATREKIFKDSYVMLMAVVDTQWEQVVIYHRSIDQFTQLSFRDIKSSSKDNNIDIGKILQSLLTGSAANL